MSDKTCISCGMPLSKPEDHAASDPSKDYCLHCADAQGNLKSYEEVLAGMTHFMVSSQGMDESVARNAATQMMSKMPAWKDRAAN